ncbi:MAG: GlsB/YeaQ/YmgE family stress response membrane protein [Ginsengibacter sp.]
MKQLTISSLIRNRFFGIIILIPCWFTTAAQLKTKKVLNPNVFHNFIKRNAVVAIKTINNGAVQNTTTDSLNNVSIPVNKKQVILYDKKIMAPDSASYRKIKSTSALTVAQQDIKIIPELHVEPTKENNDNSSEVVTYRIMFTLQQPLQYNISLKKFEAMLEFLLVNESGSNDAAIEPVNIEIVSNEATINPRSLEITHLSIPSSNVELVADHVTDSTAVKVITTSHPDGYATYLKVTPALEISTNQTTFQGFGIQEAPVTVKFIGSSSSDSVMVNFSTQKGTVTPNSIYVSYNNPQTIYLRSDGMGASKFSATSSVGDSNDLIFQYTFPWLFLLASILGGLIGSLAKYFMGGTENKSWIKPVITGILIGFIGAIAWYGLGVNLLGVSLSPTLNAFAVLALSALCAYFGISLIKLNGK